MTNIVKCPNCKKPVEWSSTSLYKPFCSERCKLIDLGAWADESYSIPTSDTSSINEEDTGEGQESSSNQNLNKDRDK